MTLLANPRSTSLSRALAGLWLLLLAFSSILPAQAEDAPEKTQPEHPARVLIFGDSIMRALGRSLNLELARKPDVRAHVFSSLGSGLARLDVFDWMAKIDEMTAQFKPDTAIVMLGINDSQPLKTSSSVVQPGSGGWNAEYSRRLGEGMDRLRRGGVKHLYWLTLPDMRSEKLQRDIDIINDLIRTAAEAHAEWVSLLDSRKVLSLTPGKYSPYVIQSNGMPIHVRDADGVHLSRKGADLLAAWIVEQIMPAEKNAE